MKTNDRFLAVAVTAALDAGSDILTIYNDSDADFSVKKKADNSPLTIADRAAHTIIADSLSKHFPDIPIMSEEGAEPPFSERREWTQYWCVDPLDGTKEFIKKNGEFTVNIALIENGVSVLGVIYVPVLDRLYFSGVNTTAYRCDTASEFTDPIGEAWKITAGEPGSVIRIMVSRSHISDDTTAFVENLAEQYDDVVMVPAGSSLKLCRVAEGSADIYPRFAPTMEWDTAAGHAIVTAAGKEVLVRDSGTPLTYNKENLLNPHFIVR